MDHRSDVEPSLMDHRFSDVEPYLMDHRSDAEPSLIDCGLLSSGFHVDISLIVDISIEKVPDIDIIPIATGDAADDEHDWNDFEGPAASNADGPRIEDDDAVSREGVFVEANTEKQFPDIDMIPISTGDAAGDDWNDFEDCSKDRRIEAAALNAPWLGSSSQPLTLRHAASNEALFRASVADQHLRESIANCALSQVITRPSD